MTKKFPKGVWGHMGWCRHVLEHSGGISSSFWSCLKSCEACFLHSRKSEKRHFRRFVRDVGRINREVCDKKVSYGCLGTCGMV